jgi:hypothetical protein
MQTTSPFSKEISLGARGWGLGARGRRASKPHAEVRTVSGIKNVLTALAVAITLFCHSPKTFAISEL